MKKAVLICPLLFIIGVIAWFIWKQTSPSTAPSPITTAPSVTPASTPIPQTDAYTLIYNGTTYAYDFFRIQPYGKLHLFPNFTDRKSGDTLVMTHECAAAISGGFYTTDNQPLGLFRSDNITMRNRIDSALLNGFISFNTTAAAVGEDPMDGASDALQTGPLLYGNGNPLPLSIRNDQHERRMIALETMEGTLIFMVVYISDATFQGPLLAELPLILRDIDTLQHFHIRDAINLDGGSASFFTSGAHTVSELQLIGSLFCLQK